MEQQILRRFERLSEQAAGCTYNVVRLADNAQSYGSMVSILTQIATATAGADPRHQRPDLHRRGRLQHHAGRPHHPAAAAPRRRVERDSGRHGRHRDGTARLRPAAMLIAPRCASERQKLPARLIFDNVTFAHQAGQDAGSGRGEPRGAAGRDRRHQRQGRHRQVYGGKARSRSADPAERPDLDRPRRRPRWARRGCAAPLRWSITRAPPCAVRCSTISPCSAMPSGSRPHARPPA